MKKLKLKYECGACGSIESIEREIVIDNYLKKIDIVKPLSRCRCGRSGRFRLVDINIKKNNHYQDNHGKTK